MESRAAAAVRAAVRDKKALAIDYYAASHDTLTSRVVDPIRVLLVGGHSYLEAWSRESEGVRLFRFDRIVDATELNEPAAPPAPVLQAPPDTSLFDGDPALPSATAADSALGVLDVRVLPPAGGARAAGRIVRGGHDLRLRRLDDAFGAGLRGGGAGA